jgi:hypothetical protein
VVWLFTQMFVLCAGAFLAGAVLTWLPMRAAIRKLRAELVASRQPVAAPTPVLPEQRTEVVQPPVEAADLPVEVVEPVAEVVEPQAEAVESPTVVVEPVAEVVEPQVEVVEPVVVEPVAEVVEPQVEVVEPVVVEPVAEVVEPQAEVVELLEEAVLPLKGNSKSRIFHTESSPYYRRMKGDVRFGSVEEAEQAGYTMWSPRSRSQLAGSAQ